MKNDLINFLFWLQYDENKELLEKWLRAEASNAFLAEAYLKQEKDRAV